ncbi:hypothetical protein O7599_13945 [Streptomyces sp. WMMC500]|uniref:hypothetical protein n=1 Tax=Streptomyces sp. WMMC500 TaxID=3015154 RepID=UPI00248C2BF5|nr:hypothetical protein [Streptomyces sp. WMMC500]WBB63553.1 hypothetical protein O7599_13945 [Streptomyces sp. WMMC500]
MKRRIQLVLGAALTLVLGFGAAFVGLAGPAGAALPGSVTLTPATGSLTAAPMFSQVKVDGVCPANHADADASNDYDFQSGFYVIKPDSTYAGSLATRVTSGAPYSQAPFTIDMPGTTKSLGAVLGADPADGVYQVEVQCRNSTNNFVAGNSFTVPIKVTGDTWEVDTASEAVETTLKLSADPAGQVVVNKEFTLVAEVTPANAEGTVEFAEAGQTGTPVEVQNGKAELELGAGTAARVRTYTATFRPDNAADFTSSNATLAYYSVHEPGIDVASENGDVLEEEAKLEGGQKVKVTAEGFRPNEAVKVTIPDSGGTFADVEGSEQGTVTEHTVTIPAEIADGDYKLTLTGADGGVKVEFPFTVGEGGGPGGGDSDGDDGGGDSDGDGGGDSDGGDNGGGDAGGAGGAAGGAGGSGAGGSGGGSDLPLASTGSAVLDLALVSVVLMAAGGGAVYWAHRSGRLLTFGATPRT